MQEDVPEQDAAVDEDNSKETEQEVKVEGESSKIRSLRERMRALLYVTTKFTLRGIEFGDTFFNHVLFIVHYILCTLISSRSLLDA